MPLPPGSAIGVARNGTAASDRAVRTSAVTTAAPTGRTSDGSGRGASAGTFDGGGVSVAGGGLGWSGGVRRALLLTLLATGFGSGYFRLLG